MGIKGKISFIAFTLGLCCLFAAIIFCALERVQISSLFGMLAAGVCCIGCVVGFGSWEEKEDDEKGFFSFHWKDKLIRLATETPLEEEKEPEEES